MVIGSVDILAPCRDSGVRIGASPRIHHSRDPVLPSATISMMVLLFPDGLEPPHLDVVLADHVLPLVQ
jgi:hypothetical protein